MTTATAGVRLVGKGKESSGPLSSRQINIRVPPATFDRLANVAESLGLDLANAIRLILAKGLPTVEEEVRQLQRRGNPD